MTSALFKKLNYRDEPEIVILNAPDSIEAELAHMNMVVIHRDLGQAPEVRFLLAFVTTLADVESIARAAAAKAKGDCLLWFGYPKGSSKKYKCEFNRDTGWAALGEQGFEPVRQVAIDEDWSALRFRRVEYIKSLTRGEKITFSAQGRERIKNI